jgi:general secretion pathway protein G
MRSLLRRRSAVGFTLVELLVVIAIVALLAGMLLTAVSFALRRAKRTQAVMELKLLETALEMYRTDFYVYPPDRAAGWDSGQSLVFYLGTVFRAGQAPTPPWGGGALSWTADRSGGPYFEFPADRLDSVGHFIDPWGREDRDGTGQVYYYRWDNNEAENGGESWGTSATNWNQTNVHPRGVDIWTAGPNGLDAGVDGDPEPGPPNGPLHVRADTTVLSQFARKDDVGNW